MRNFLKNTKGAVTVLVTLLLIPAILISGTAVDLARIHTARSIVQDANQLAANAVLTQYNALLYDLYAVFGVAKDDPILAQLLDEYISVSVFGESSQDRSLGTLQLFYGSNLSLDEPGFAEGKNLRNEDILRRQIEEYMKFRGPVIIVKEMLELLGSSTFKEDSGVISDKLEIEEAIAEIYEKYKELYNAIIAADKCDQVSGGIANVTVGTVSSRLEEIRKEFVDLRACYIAWEAEEDSYRKNDYELKYRAILANIRARTIGGSPGSNWNNGRWGKTGSSQGLNTTIENAKGFADRHKPEFDKVVSIARQIDSMKGELSRKIDALESRLTSGDCNEELKAALTEKTGSPPKSMIDRYREILKFDNIEGMADIYKDSGIDYIDNIVKPLLDSVMYRNASNSTSPCLTRSELGNILTHSRLGLSEAVQASNSLAFVLGGYSVDNVTYKMPAGFKKFGDHPGKNKEFFELLKQMMNQPNTPPVKLYDGQAEAGGSNAETKQRNMINRLMDMATGAFAGMANNPLGARYINNSTDAGTGSFKASDIKSLISQAGNDPVSDVLSDPYGSVARAGDYILLLSYSTSVFSNYATARPEITGKKKSELQGIGFPKSITGIPLSPEVNYFFQSEWEYLYNGDKNASKNLSAVSRLIYIVRLICNYITVYSVNEVTTIVTAIRTAFAWNPPLSLLLGELARAAFVAAESAIDVATLRAGYKVPLIKSGRSGEWICSSSGVAKALAEISAEVVSEKNNSKNEGLSYSNYLLFFFISKAVVSSNAVTELAVRTGNLIEWNVINYKKGVFSDEGKMEEALSEENRFKLEDMKTDFFLTTTVEMRMLFLSMVFAQNFSNSRGIGMPSTMPVTVTDYRGY
jgi:hypothetical protein